MNFGIKMKVGTILTATDLNPLYSEFIPNFIKAWNILFPHADVVVVLVADNVPDNLKQYEQNLRLFKPIPNIHSAFQAQCIRLLYPRLIERDEGVLITDMDMLPMNRSYYVDHIQNISDDTFITYRDVCLPTEIAMCYNIATPKIWHGVFGNDSIEVILQSWYVSANYDGQHGGQGWGTDQQILLKKFNCWEGPKVTLNDSITKFNRLDRIHPWVFSNKDQLKQIIQSGLYIDYHCLRPYSAYKEINDFVVSCLV
jgi:hypothetical protein